MNRSTKIVITLGPASSKRETLERLLKAGANVIRLNFSHGTHEGHAANIRLVRELCGSLGIPVTILQDLQGPKIRTGEIEGGVMHLTEGDTLFLTTEEIVGSGNRVSVDFADLPSSVQPGSRILLDDGNLELGVVKVQDHEIETKVLLGGDLKPHKGVNLPGAKLNILPITEKDEEDLAFGLEQGVDAVAMSFVRRGEDVVRLRQTIQRLAPDRASIPIISKLERPEALENLEAILDQSDGVMVARGDLGVEMTPEAVPIAQKQIIEAANKKARLVITATQMLESMIENPRPTRAEASDVANAIFDGTDAVMLSGETAVGKYPVQAVEMMGAIIRSAEPRLEKWGHWKSDPDGCLPVEEGYDQNDSISITRAAAELARDRNVAAIAVFTQSGRTARYMSKARPDVPILAFTPNQPTYQILPMMWGVVPYLIPYADTMEDMLEDVEEAMITASPLRPGQQVVLISGFPIGAMRQPNLALLYTIGDLKTD